MSQFGAKETLAKIPMSIKCHHANTICSCAKPLFGNVKRLLWSKAARPLRSDGRPAEPLSAQPNAAFDATTRWVDWVSKALSVNRRDQWSDTIAAGLRRVQEVENAKWIIAQNRQALHARRHGVRWLHRSSAFDEYSTGAYSGTRPFTAFARAP
jgi:hypothetical protein